MSHYVVRRALLTVVTLLLFSLILFVLVRMLPGDAALLKSASGEGSGPVDPAVTETLRKQFHLDRPVLVQYVDWLVAISHGDLGRSFWTGDRAAGDLIIALPVTFELVLMSVTFSVTIGLVVGVFSAVYRDRPLDHALRLFALFGLSIPNFWVGTILILIPALVFHYLPPLGYTSIFANPEANLRQFIAPAAALGWALSGSIMRLTRSEMLEVLHQDYIRTAWAKGLRGRSVLYGHCLRNAFIPVITIIGVQVGFLLGGTVAVESVYGLPGVGTLLLNGVNQRDYPIIQTGVLALAVWFIAINFLVDLAYAVIDPRIRLSAEGATG